MQLERHVGLSRSRWFLSARFWGQSAALIRHNCRATTLGRLAKRRKDSDNYDVNGLLQEALEAMALPHGLSPTTSVEQLKRELEAARRENRRFRTLLLSQALEVWAADSQGQHAEIICDDGNAVMPGSLMPLQLRLEHIHQDDLPQLQQVIDRARQTGLPFSIFLRGKRDDGNWRRLHIRGFPLAGETGEIEEWVGTVSDLTVQAEMEAQNLDLTRRLQLALQNAVAQLSERKRMEDMLVCQNSILDSIASGAPLPQTLAQIVLLVENVLRDTIGSIMSVDGEWLSLAAGPNLPPAYSALIQKIQFGPTTGSCGSAASTGKPTIVVDIDTDPLWKDYRQHALANGLKACWSVPIIARTSVAETSGEVKPRVLGTFGLYHRQQTRPSDADLEIVCKAAYLAAIAMERELNSQALRASEERLAMQSAELFHATRISSLGLMAAAISHEINQPLVAISNYSAACSRMLASREPDAHGKLVDCFERMNAAALQAGQIIRRLRSFVRKEQTRQQLHDFHHVIMDAIELMGAELRMRQVKILAILDTSPALVWADEVQLQQVIVNLLTNAADAMSEQSNSTRLITVDSSVDEKTVQCRITDTGPGFSEEVKDWMFEPFKTTKKNGSGIGLSICRNIVQDHGGTIEIDNSSRGGAMVVIRLPLTDR